MTAPPPWLRPWPEVMAAYARLERLKDQFRRAAEAVGIECRLKREPKK